MNIYKTEQSMRAASRDYRSVGILLSLTAMLAVAGCEKNVEAPEVIRPVRVIRIATADDLSGRAMPGRARATEETNLSFDVPGTVLERLVNVGDEVESGQLLARLDQRDYRNQAAAATAARNRARANFERIQIAVKSGAVAKQDLDDARAQLDVRQAEMNIAEKAIQDSEIHAPRAGTISATYVEQYTAVQAKEAVLRLLDTSAIEMVIQIPESLISLVPDVTNIQVVFDAFAGRPVPARIQEISNEASQTTRTYPVTLIMAQPEDFKILPGMAGRATGTLPAGTARSLRGFQVPASAVFSGDEPGAVDQSFVWIVDETQGTVGRRQVTAGPLSRFGIVITEGISAGELVVISGVNYLVEGQEVRPLLPEDAS
jgi:RND family efflux transporter MFP subunit